MEFTHLDAQGQARMVDVTGKQPTVRAAGAEARVACSPAVIAALRDGTVPKGDVLAVARVAGIAAAKKVPDLLPLAHVIGVHGVVLDVEIDDGGVWLRSEVRTADRTGVEMEALTAVQVALLTIYDMCKASDKTMVMTDVRLREKHGGKSGSFVADAVPVADVLSQEAP